MQQKEFEVTFRQVIPPLTGVTSLVIENTGLSKLNFHGIRMTGRINLDPAEGTNQFASGFATLMCIPNDQIVIPTLLTEADINDSNSFIIAIEAWQCVIGSSNQGTGYSSTYDFKFAPKTSRSCMRGGKLVSQVTNNAPVADAVVTHLLSSFETF